MNIVLIAVDTLRAELADELEARMNAWAAVPILPGAQGNDRDAQKSAADSALCGHARLACRAVR